MTAFANRHGTGSFRRRHLLVALDDRTVAAGIEDEMHHFELEVHHDGRAVTDITGTPIRWPWTPCYDSPQALRALVGLPLDAAPAAIARFTAVSEQCTHQFDLVTLAVAHAARVGTGGARPAGVRDRGARLVGPAGDRPAVARRRAVPRLGVRLRDGHVTCTVRGTAHPGRLLRLVRGEPRRRDCGGRAGASPLGLDLARRKLDLEDYDAAEPSGIKHGICYTSQPSRLPVAFRNRGSLRDYGRSGADLLAGFDDRHPCSR